ncbi:aminopeptidase [Haladaptatus sp. DYSN1]|uniref:aminopeptidase n=1 Tax=unclassified Haladaptatus TaxID=2622732 RepID=UPI002405A05C|nr:aminopeptidase [Haladaptatus sp. DYSN1]
MDPRIREQAKVIVEHSTGVERGDNVVVNGSPESEDLVVAIAKLCGEIGATVQSKMSSERATRAYMRAIDEDDIDLNEMALAEIEAADVFIAIRGQGNVNEQSDVSPQKNQKKAAENRDLQEAYLEKRWNLTQYPTKGGAQKAEMSTDAYEDFVWSAVNKDWTAVEEHQAQLVEILDGADEVHIKSGDTTDVSMSIAGNHVINDWGEHNMPGGEVFTAPVPDSVEGEVLFDKPVMVQGREINGAWLKFEGGEVVEFSAEKNEEMLEALLETDDGARRLGELGIGMNRDIDQFTYNMLFDEKMGDTVHMAVGRAYDDTVGEGNERNDSVVHTDMIVDMSEDSFIKVDGEVVQRNGTFRFEDGFEG